MSKFKVGDRVRVARKTEGTTDGAARNLSSYLYQQWFDAVYNAPASIIRDLGPDITYRYVIQLDDVALQHRYHSSFYVCADVELEAMLPELPEDL